MHAQKSWVELAVRLDDQLVVTLYWRAFDDATAIRLVDSRRGESAFALVPGECALDALRHPLWYLPGRGSASTLAPQRLDVDELWLSELAASLIADLADLLAPQPGAGGSSDGVL